MLSQGTWLWIPIIVKQILSIDRAFLISDLEQPRICWPRCQPGYFYTYNVSAENRQNKMILITHSKWNNWQITENWNPDPPERQVSSNALVCDFFFHTDNCHRSLKKRKKNNRSPLSLDNYFLKANGSKCSYLKKKMKMFKGYHHSNCIKPPWTKYPNCGCLNKLKHFCT